MEIYTVASSPCGSIVLPCRDKPFKDKSVIVERDCKQWAAAQRSPHAFMSSASADSLKSKIPARVCCSVS